MKKVIVLSALLLMATVSLTSCGNKTADAAPDVTEAPADSLTQPEVDTTQVTAPDTLVEKK
jgi:predicted small lipoprotein YifL